MNVDISEDFQFLNVDLKSLSYGEFTFHDMWDNGGPFLNKLSTPLSKGWWEKWIAKAPYIFMYLMPSSPLMHEHWAWVGIGRVYPGFG